jgi:hypothetical protein
MPLDIREHRLPWYNFNNQSAAMRRRPFEGDCVAGQPGRLAAQPGDCSPWWLYLPFRC